MRVKPTNMQEESSNNNIGGSFLYSFFVTVISGVVTVAYPLAIGLLFGAETMGDFSVLFYWSTFLSIPIANGIAPAIARFIAANKKTDHVQYQTIGTKMSLLYVLIISIVFPLLSFLVFDLTVVEFFLVLPLIILTITHFLIRYTLQGQEKFKDLLKLEIIAFSVFLPFMVVFSILPHVLNWSGLSAFYFLLIPIIAYHLTIDLIYFIPRIKKVYFKEFFKFPEITKKILLYALFIGIGSLFSLGTSQIQVVISDLYVSEFEVGVLSFWNSAVTPINIITVALGGILLPRVTNLRKIDRQLSQKLVNSFNWSFSMIIIPIIGLVFLLFSKYPVFLDIITFNKYNMVYYWIIVILLVFRAVIYLINSPTIAFYASFEKKVMISPIASFVFSLTAVLAWIFLVPLIDVFGFAVGIALGGVLSFITVQVFALINTKGKIGYHFIFGILFFGLNALGIYLLEVINYIWILVVWSIISIPIIVYGVLILVRILSNKGYSQIVDDVLIED